MIVGGDWNCVPDTTLDTRSNSNTPYPNQHAGLLEMELASKGLTDIYRRVNGNERGYTRTGDTIHTRLDRLYAKRYDAEWRWTRAEHDPTLFRGAWDSDHTPVIATLETTPSREPTASEAKIDPTLYHSQSVRVRVREAWVRTYNSYPRDEYSRATAWDQAKLLVCSLLMDETSSRRRTRTNLRAFAAAMLKHHHASAHTAGPSAKFQKVKRKIEAQLKHTKAPSAKQGWWAYISSLNEEVSSKNFYRRFRAKFSNSDISSLHVTPDWNAPDVKSGVVQDVVGIVEQLSNYYTYLFRRKASVNAGPFLELLQKRKLREASRKALDKPITVEDVSKAIRSLGKGKSPGPDLLTAEFYQTFEDILAEPLTEVLTESHTLYRLPTSTQQGVVKILYKKKDPRDIRNYRPLTMLNTDYKILTKILAYRIAGVLDEIVSPQQLGFVPGRVITEASHLVKLVQGYLDESDEEGILVALDWEKAFDSVSWDYLHQSIDALGFGPYIKRWYHILYNPYNPQERIVQANGQRSPVFHLQSGIPQGCPLSPVTFLFISEGLTRVILEDTEYEGITIGNATLKLSQFADDTLLMLRSYSGLKRAWELIAMYADATGMRVNVRKTEGIRCGALTRKPIPNPKGARTDMIQWVKKGEWVRLLGIPFWEEYNESLFWEQLYLKSKAKLACWRHHNLLTQIGRIMLANTMYLSRFRYWLQCMAIPDYINDALVADTQALIWSKTFDFDADEVGTHGKYRRWMKDQAQYGNRVRDLGLSVIDWKAHVLGIRSRWIFRYLDPTRGEYKLVLDQWFARFPEGRGAVLTTMNTNDLTKATTSGVRSGLPRFWKLALRDTRTLCLERMHPGQCLNAQEAQAMPLWHNPLFHITSRLFIQNWREHLDINLVRDTFKCSVSEEYSQEDVTDIIKDTFNVANGRIRASGGKLIAIHKLLTQWKHILDSIPEFIQKGARGTPIPYPQYSAQALSMLKKWVPGWKEGSGIPNSTGAGIANPIPHDTRNRISRKQEVKDRKSKYKAFLAYNTIPTYGTYDPTTETFHVYDLTTQGRITPSSVKHCIRPHRIREVLFWGRGVVGIADATFPHPEGWTVRGSNCDLTSITVKLLTAAFRYNLHTVPSCVAAWEKRLGVNINWCSVGLRYRQRLLTPRDFMTHYKLILHRGLFTRSQSSVRIDDTCRLCNAHKETIRHLANCPKLKPMWDKYCHYCCITSTTPLDRECILLLGVREDGRALPQAPSDFLLIVWKFILINFTLVDLKQQKFIPEEVWKGAVRRYISKANTLTFKIMLKQIRSENGRGEIETRLENELLAPLGSIDSDGTITWADPFNSLIELVESESSGRVIS